MHYIVYIELDPSQQYAILLASIFVMHLPLFTYIDVDSDVWSAESKFSVDNDFSASSGSYETRKIP